MTNHVGLKFLLNSSAVDFDLPSTNPMQATRVDFFTSDTSSGNAFRTFVPNLLLATRAQEVVVDAGVVELVRTLALRHHDEFTDLLKLGRQLRLAAPASQEDRYVNAARIVRTLSPEFEAPIHAYAMR